MGERGWGGDVGERGRVGREVGGGEGGRGGEGGMTYTYSNIVQWPDRGPTFCENCIVF